MSSQLPPGLKGPTKVQPPAVRATAAWASLVKAIHRDLPAGLHRSALMRRKIRALSHSKSRM